MSIFIFFGCGRYLRWRKILKLFFPCGEPHESRGKKGRDWFTCSTETRHKNQMTDTFFK